jgi:iron complex outermembrane receptor protein
MFRSKIAGGAMRCIVLSSWAASAHAQEEPPAPVLTPPRVVESFDPAYPAEDQGSGRAPIVALDIEIGPDGVVQHAEVDDSGGPSFDREAIASVYRWRFAPATRDGAPITGRVRVEVRFELPVPPEEEEIDEPPPIAPPPPEEQAPPELGVEAQADQIDPRSASEHTIGRDVLDAAPHDDAGSLLGTVPGLFAARGEGDAVAHSLMLRGFDAEHGQDIELSVDGIPINLPSHLHGQGYADLGFVMPEIVRSISVIEGVYDPAQGDFAVAGSVDLRLGIPRARRGVTSRTTYGSFQTFRQFLMWAPEDEDETTFGAAQYRRSDGFGQGRQSEGGSAVVSLALGDRPWRGRLIAIAHAARASIAGVLREEDIDANEFHGRYDDPSAEAQSALALRFILGASAENRGERGRRTRASVWASFDDFRLQTNFTGYTQRSRVMPEWTGRGDLIEQRNQTFSVGLRAEHETERHELAEWLHSSITIGLAGRVDSISQAQTLLAAQQNETWDERVDASIIGADVGAWLDLDLQITEHVRLRGGLRGDALFYDIDDRLGNFIPADRRESYILGFRRTAFGLAAGPRASLEVRPIPELALTLAYGEGYRSPQARQLADGESAPFTKVRSGDLGARLTLGEELEVAATAYATFLSNDVAFEAQEGRLEPVGPTTRLGGVLYARAQPISWLTAALSVTYVHATIDEPPPATAEDPTPAFEPGSLLPFIAPWIVRADVGVGERLFDLDDHPVRGHIGIGFSFLSPRPLPFGQEADPVALLDAEVSASWRWFTIGVSAFNLFDTRWSASELFFVSNWRPSEAPSRLPTRHISAGAPLTVLGTLGVTL